MTAAVCPKHGQAITDGLASQKRAYHSFGPEGASIVERSSWVIGARVRGV